MNRFIIRSITVLLLVLVMAPAQDSLAQDINRAGLVVQFGDGSLETRCVEFSEASISGLELLERSGMPVLAAYDPSMGAMVCKIQDEGCPVDDCLCESPPDYWSYWHLQGGSWVYSPAGSSTFQVTDGVVEGWSWGPGLPPPLMTINEICSSPSTATSTHTAVLTQTPVTPAPTETSMPSPTPTLAPTTAPPPTNTAVPATEPSSQSQNTLASTDTPPAPTETSSASPTEAPTGTATQVLPTEPVAPTNTLPPLETNVLAQGPYPEPSLEPPYPGPEPTLVPPTSPPVYPEPPYPEPSLEPTLQATMPAATATLTTVYAPPTEAAATTSLLDRFINATAGIRYPLLCTAWIACGGSIALLLVGWAILLIRMRRK
jgi:hypothetical protein